MKYLITYIILSYPIMATLVFMRLNEFKEGFKKAMGGDAMANAGLGIAKGVYKKSGLNKTLKSPVVIIPIVIVAIIATPFVWPIFIYDIILGGIKKIILLLKKSFPPQCLYRARKIKKDHWIIETYFEGEWIAQFPNWVFTDKKNAISQAYFLNDLAQKSKKEKENVPVQ